MLYTTSHSAYHAKSTESDGVNDFSLLISDSGGTFGLHFWNLHKIRYKNPSILTPSNSVDVAAKAE